MTAVPGWPMTIGMSCLLVAVMLFVWSGALTGDFHFDDYGNIVENRAVRALWPLDSFLTNGRPVGLYSFAINYHFYGLDPAGYRWPNVLIHIVNALLLFAGVQLTLSIAQRQTGGTQEGTATVEQRARYYGLILSTLIALVWGIHPLTTQAVTNIVQRYESLATMGYLGAWCGLLLVISGRRWGAVLVLIAAWIGLPSKEVFATAPLVIVLFDRLVSGNTWVEIRRQRWLPYSLMLTPYLWFIPSVLRWFDPTRSTSMGFGLKSVTWWGYLRTQPEVIFHYLRLTVWPDPLCFDYAWRVQMNSEVYLTGGLCILAILGAGAWLYINGLSRTQQLANGVSISVTGLAGWLILSFFFVLAPTSSLIPIADLCVEHRMYLPLAIVVVGLVLALDRFRHWCERRATQPNVVRAGTALALLAGLMSLSWRTHLRNLDYQNGIRLWETVLNVRPDNPRAWFMLGSEYLGRGEPAQALPHLEKAVGAGMPIAIFHTGLADCLRELGRTEEAVHHYQRAIELKPDWSKSYNGLGVIQHRNGDLAAARQSFQQGTDLGLPEARYNLAAVLIDLQEYPEAAALLETVLADQPNFSLAARRLAWILATAEEKDLRNGVRAQQLLTQHFELETSDSPFVWDTHAAVLAELEEFDAAVAAAQKAWLLAKSRQDSNLSASIQKRLTQYQHQMPWREESVP